MMSVIQPCQHGSDYGACVVDGCPHNLAGPVSRATARVAVRAVHEGRCMACATPIEVDDPIVMSDSRWIHEGCA